MRQLGFICLFSVIGLLSCGPEEDVYTKTDYGNALGEHLRCPVDSTAFFTPLKDPNTQLVLNVPEGFSAYAYEDGDYGYSGVEGQEIDPEFEFD